MSEITPAAPPPPFLPFRRPADYYAAPVEEVRPILPRWAAFGCGSASLVAIVVLFGSGALIGGGKGGELFAYLMATVEDEIHGMQTKEVTAAQKAALDAEMTALRTNLKRGKVSIDKLQPLLRVIREASMDGKITPEETTNLARSAHDVNGTVGQRPTPALSGAEGANGQRR